MAFLSRDLDLQLKKRFPRRDELEKQARIDVIYTYLLQGVENDATHIKLETILTCFREIVKMFVLCKN